MKLCLLMQHTTNEYIARQARVEEEKKKERGHVKEKNIKGRGIIPCFCGDLQIS